jgi:hypothetical protein
VSNVHEGWLALAGAVLGGSGLKVIEFWLSRGKRHDDEETIIRKELREEVKYLHQELKEVQEELDEWREKYYALREEFIGFRSKLKNLR